MEEKKSVAQFMFKAHLTVFIMQFFYETGLGLCLFKCFTCCIPCLQKEQKVEEGSNMEALLERTEEEQEAFDEAEKEKAQEEELANQSVIGPSVSTFV